MQSSVTKLIVSKYINNKKHWGKKKDWQSTNVNMEIKNEENNEHTSWNSKIANNEYNPHGINTKNNA